MRGQTRRRITWLKVNYRSRSLQLKKHKHGAMEESVNIIFCEAVASLCPIRTICGKAWISHDTIKERFLNYFDVWLFFYLPLQMISFRSCANATCVPTRVLLKQRRCATITASAWPSLLTVHHPCIYALSAPMRSTGKHISNQLSPAGNAVGQN